MLVCELRLSVPQALDDAVHRAVVPRPADVIHDLVAAILDYGGAHAGGDVVERRVPAHSHPAAGATLADALHGIQDALGVADLIDRRRSLGAGAAATSRMYRVAFEATDLAGELVDVGEQAAARLAVEADCRDERIVALDPARPGAGFVFDPVVPVFGIGRAAQRPARVFLGVSTGSFRHRFVSA